MELKYKLILMFVMTWTIGQACNIPHLENLLWCSFITLSFAWLENAHGKLWDYFTSVNHG